LYADIASAGKDQPVSERRGSIGTMFSYKIAGSYASDGHSLDEVIAYVESVRDNTRSIASAMTSGTSPITGATMFENKPGEVLVGLGVHGEAALQTYQDKTCSQIPQGMIASLVEDKPYKEGDEVAVFVNSAGSTSTMELMIYYSSVEDYLSSKGIRVCHPLIGRYITTQEMGGIGLAICKMDDAMKANWVKPTNAPHFAGV
jgi:dihydroxyacetone kinase-like protein